MGRVVAREACPDCREKGRDNKGDNLARYADGSAYCHSCSYFEPAAGKNGKAREVNRMEKSSTTVAQVEGLSSIKALPERNISYKIAERYGVRVSVDEQTGENAVHYYPYFNRGKLVGYKQRRLPKSFSSIGSMSDVGLFGQQIYEGNNRKLLILTEGEIDCLSVAEILENAGKQYAVCSVQNGADAEGTIKAPLRAQAEFFASFEKVILCFDNDGPGEVYALAVADWLCTLTKVGIMPVGEHFGDFKDVNDLLCERGTQRFWAAFKNTKEYQPESIVRGEDITIEQLQQVPHKGYELPFEGLQHMLKGLRKGELTLATGGCVDRDTEYLTPVGWKAIGDYDGGLVAQYHEDGTISFVEPKAYHKIPCEKLWHLKTKYGLEQILSDEHTFVYWNQFLPTMQKLPFHEVMKRHKENVCGFTGKVSTVFDWSGPGMDITEGDLRLQVAVIADGRVVREGTNNYTQMRFTEDRKYFRLLELCSQYNLRHDDRGVNNQGHYEVIVWPKYKDKEFDSKYWSCTKEQLKIILDEHVHWDTYAKKKAFSTTKKASADFIQFAYAATGHRASINIDSRTEKYDDGYCATVIPARNSMVGMTNRPGEKKVEINEWQTTDGYKYCFTVPTGLLVLRCNNRIFISGNSGLGKTSVVKEICLDIALRQRATFGYMSLEESVEMAARSFIAMYHNIPVGRLTFYPDALSAEQWEEARQALFASGLFTFFDSSKFLDFDALMNKVEFFARGVNCDFLVIDNLTLIAARSDDGDERKAIDKTMAALAGIAASTGIGIILVNHLKRQNNKSPNNGDMVEIQDLRGSGSLEAFSNNIIAVERNQQAEDEVQRNSTRIRVLKNRLFGKTGVACSVLYNPDTGRMAEPSSDF